MDECAGVKLWKWDSEEAACFCLMGHLREIQKTWMWRNIKVRYFIQKVLARTHSLCVRACVCLCVRACLYMLEREMGGWEGRKWNERRGEQGCVEQAEKRERERESLSSSSHVTGAFPRRRQQCSTLRCSEADRSAEGIWPEQCVDVSGCPLWCFPPCRR